ncbi:hypothetical protein CQW23_18196 [Capsicum baccatum]|uniref:Uncharacterized protein n=1 Tax=Capsicum baccatum TaxID=33114 RepID=A0A2G2WG10_CAPBA|nr:hypothetical protein CQW23_18196 [Capsicum baccatum]
MNRDSGPFFSFGFSQLETIKEYEDIVNFVSDSFDYETVDFNENRSKHRNDPHTMKKLRQKQAKKYKKKEIHGSKKRGSDNSTSKAPAKRRKVVEVISRDELPKVFACSNLLNKLNEFYVILYYLNKKYNNKNFSTNRYTITDCSCKVYIEKTYVNYYNVDVGKELATQDAFARTDEVAQMEMSLINTIKGLSITASQPWNLVNEVFILIN